MSDYQKGNGCALDWNDEIQYTESSFLTLPAGEYPFTVTSFDRQNYDGGSNIPPCKMAVLHLAVDGGDQGTANVNERLYLHTAMLWKLSEFFHAIGQLRKDGAVQMNWNAVPGATGRVKLTVNKYEKNGQERTNNRVEHFLPPEERSGGAGAAVSGPAQGSAPQWQTQAAPAQQQAMEGFQRQGRVAEWQPGKF